MKYYEVYIEELQQSKLERQRLWKFLVELPEGPHGESKAMAVAKEAGGTELRNDFKNATIQAKLVPIDAAKLDSAKSIMKDECRVWILQKASGFEANPFL